MPMIIPKIDRATAFIDRRAITHNIKIAKSISPSAKIMAVVKANGYGHGMLNTANILSPFVHGYAVARYEEAQALRANGISQEILVMSPTNNFEQLQDYPFNNFTVAVHTKEMLEFAMNMSNLSYWVKIDTGMHRLGIDQDELSQYFLQEPLKNQPKVLMTHFSEAQKKHSIATQKQLHCFIDIFKSSNIDAFSISNSAAIVISENQEAYSQWQSLTTTSLSNSQEYLRPGLMIYGVDPLDTPNQVSTELKPAMTLAAPIISIRSIKSGDSVGYNSKWTAKRDSRIATIAIGYADGYPRHAKNGTPILINGKRTALAGTVSMDSLCVDITDHQDEIILGDTAILWGNDLPINRIAKYADTIAYDLMTAIAERVEKAII
ncbi:MAG: alanine racemase [Cellvibrionales bacterium]|nr:alanine racemase [Cellvibrionales bacterium]|tara:strand:+ start:4891 stop:6024 length:1134 start_codon:yes stop_codon:yes gene_type:complete